MKGGKKQKEGEKNIVDARFAQVGTHFGLVEAVVGSVEEPRNVLRRVLEVPGLDQIRETLLRLHVEERFAVLLNFVTPAIRHGLFMTIVLGVKKKKKRKVRGERSTTKKQKNEIAKLR